MRDSAFNESHDHDDVLPSEWQFSVWDEIAAANNEIGELTAELRGVKEDRNALEIELRSSRARVDAETFDLLQSVRDWFDRTVLNVPVGIRRRLDDVVRTST